MVVFQWGLLYLKTAVVVYNDSTPIFASRRRSAQGYEFFVCYRSRCHGHAEMGALTHLSGIFVAHAHRIQCGNHLKALIQSLRRPEMAQLSD